MILFLDITCPLLNQRDYSFLEYLVILNFEKNV